MKTQSLPRLLRTVLVFTAATALSLAGVQAASATELPDIQSPLTGEGQFLSSEDLDALVPGGSAVLDPDVFLQGLQELETSEVQRVAVVDGDYTNYQYIVPEGTLTLPSAADVAAAIEESEGDLATGGTGFEVTPFLEVRFSGIKMAVGFNTVDQQALASGGAAVLAAALCLIPGVGWAACTLIGVVVGVATTYLVANGICSGGRTLWWYDVQGGSVIVCRSSAPF